MSDELIEAETAPVPVAKAGKPSAATILGILLLLAAVGAGLYVGSFWQAHNSRIARLKAKNGDFIQLQHRADVDEYAPPTSGSGDKEGANQAQATPEPKEPNWYDAYTEELFPKPVQVVYWKDPALGPEDIDLLLEFSDLEVLSVKCESIDASVIEKFLAIPTLRLLTIEAGSIDVSTIANWKIDKKLVSLTLVGTNWKSEDMRDVVKQSKENESLKGKLNVTNSSKPSFMGA